VRSKVDVIRLRALVRSIKKTSSDLVHVNASTLTNNRYALLSAALARTPAVATVHLPLSAASRTQRLALSVYYRQAARVIAVSAEVARVLRSECHVAEGRISTVANGVTVTGNLRPRRAPGDTVVVGAMGRLVAQKGFDVLLEASRRLSLDRVRLQLRIAGEGPEQAALSRQATGMDVIWDGQVEDTDAWLDGLDVFCLPSRLEGLPFALLEAMARGLPCVATDVGDVRATVGSGVVLVAPEDPEALATAMRGLIEDRQSMRDLGAAAAQAVISSRCTATDMALETLAIYHRALGRRG
jgi:glycosyltransferase involved in cell wall biosynthesis